MVSTGLVPTKISVLHLENAYSVCAGLGMHTNMAMLDREEGDM